MKKKSSNSSFKYIQKFSLGVLLLTSLGFSFNAQALYANTDPSSVASIQQQTKKLLKGVVKDKDGSFLPGATIQVKGETTGTSTNEDGKFELSVPVNCTLTFRYVGFNDYSVVITPATKELTIILTSTSVGLDEVIVTGVASGTPIKKLGYQSKKFRQTN